MLENGLEECPCKKKVVKDMVNALNVWNITNKTKGKPIAKEKML